MSNAAITIIQITGEPADIDGIHDALAATAGGDRATFRLTALLHAPLVGKPEVARTADRRIHLYIALHWRLDALAEAGGLAARFPSVEVAAAVSREGSCPAFEAVLWRGGKIVSRGLTEDVFQVSVRLSKRRIATAELFRCDARSIEAFRALDGLADNLAAVVSRLSPFGLEWRVERTVGRSAMAWRQTPEGATAILDTTGWGEDPARPFVMIEGICPSGSYASRTALDLAGLAMRFPNLLRYFAAAERASGATLFAG